LNKPAAFLGDGAAIVISHAGEMSGGGRPEGRTAREDVPVVAVEQRLNGLLLAGMYLIARPDPTILSRADSIPSGDFLLSKAG